MMCFWKKKTFVKFSTVTGFHVLSSKVKILTSECYKPPLLVNVYTLKALFPTCHPILIKSRNSWLANLQNKKHSCAKQ